MVDVARRPVRAPAPSLERRDEVALCVFGTWMVTGLYLDGWAHINNKPESFFTPWHAVLYSGFAAAVAYFATDRYRHRTGQAPPPDRVAMAGLGMFFLGGVGDVVWHSIFGVEADLEAVLSPTHLLLLAGGVALISAPIRSAWAVPGPRSPGMRSFMPTLVATTLAALVLSFFLMYLSAFDLGTLDADGLWTAYYQQAHGVASVLTTNILLLGAGLMLLRRWRPPAGSFTVLFGAVALGMVGMNGFTRPLLILPAVAGGLTADALARADSRRRAARLIGAVVPVVMWGTWMVAVNATGGIEWAPELVAGTVVMAAFTGLLLSVLVFPMPEPAAVPD